ncbi:hypothetical protein EI94DRAFT_1785894 [Lactarius quietus]|nr:hypothetical protein EI94DRAFT_1785894 [Lactarius quietus]
MQVEELNSAPNEERNDGPSVPELAQRAIIFRKLNARPCRVTTQQFCCVDGLPTPNSPMTCPSAPLDPQHYLHVMSPKPDETDLGVKVIVEVVGEARARVHEHAHRVNAVHERASRSSGIRHDAVHIVRAARVDVRNCDCERRRERRASARGARSRRRHSAAQATVRRKVGASAGLQNGERQLVAEKPHISREQYPRHVTPDRHPQAFIDGERLYGIASHRIVHPHFQVVHRGIEAHRIEVVHVRVSYDGETCDMLDGPHERASPTRDDKVNVPILRLKGLRECKRELRASECCGGAIAAVPGYSAVSYCYVPFVAWHVGCQVQALDHRCRETPLESPHGYLGLCVSLTALVWVRVRVPFSLPVKNLYPGTWAQHPAGMGASILIFSLIPVLSGISINTLSNIQHLHPLLLNTLCAHQAHRYFSQCCMFSSFKICRTHHRRVHQSESNLDNTDYVSAGVFEMGGVVRDLNIATTTQSASVDPTKHNTGTVQLSLNPMLRTTLNDCTLAAWCQLGWLGVARSKASMWAFTGLPSCQPVRVPYPYNPYLTCPVPVPIKNPTPRHGYGFSRVWVWVAPKKPADYPCGCYPCGCLAVVEHQSQEKMLREGCGGQSHRD